MQNPFRRKKSSAAAAEDPAGSDNTNTGAAAVKEKTAPDPDAPGKATTPTQLNKPTWRYVLKRGWAEFNKDQCTDLAAGLTYYAVLAVFPALLALVSLLGLFGDSQSTVNTMLDMARSMGLGDAATQLEGPLQQMTQARGAGLALFTGLLGALWSASGYVGGFGRAMNRIYEVDEGRPVWKLRPVMFALTAALVVMAAVVATGLVISGSVAQSIGDVVGLGSAAVTAWKIVKWPVMLVIVMMMVALLYYLTPNVKQPKFRWMSMGAGIAILVWILASALFGFYVSHFGSYNKTYGALAGVIIFLLWLWLTNTALLFGAEVDAEVERGRQLQAGIEAEETIQLPPRDARGSEKKARKQEELVQEGLDLRRDSDDSDRPSKR